MELRNVFAYSYKATSDFRVYVSRSCKRQKNSIIMIFYDISYNWNAIYIMIYFTNVNIYFFLTFFWWISEFQQYFSKPIIWITYFVSKVLVFNTMSTFFMLSWNINLMKSLTSTKKCIHVYPHMKFQKSCFLNSIQNLQLWVIFSAAMLKIF